MDAWLGKKGSVGTGRGTDKDPIRKKGDKEASLYPSLVTVKCRPLPHCLDLWPLQDVDKWDGV